MLGEAPLAMLPLTLNPQLTELTHLITGTSPRREGFSSMVFSLAFQVVRSEVGQNGREVGGKPTRSTVEGGPSLGACEGHRPPQEGAIPRPLTVPL